MRLPLLPLLALLPSSALAWGIVGHEIIATIAQVHLLPSTRATVRSILPPADKGHLAPQAGWADRIKFFTRWSSPLHYINAVDDHPPGTCAFGEKGWVDEERNVLEAIGNYSFRVTDLSIGEDERDYALRFLVHYVGDVHQPLHLTGRERGGNGDNVVCEHRHLNLHALWDSYLIARKLRSQTNYTRPLPSAQVEHALRGSIYDPWVRLILWEGVRVWWRDALAGWLICPSSSTLLESSPAGQLPFSASAAADPPSHLCPLSWAAKTHAEVTCPLTFAYETWPASLRRKGDGDDVPQVCVPAYLDPILKNNVLERLMAQGGLRLAAVLNEALGDPEEVRVARTVGLGMPLDLSWAEEWQGGGSRIWGRVGE